MRRNRNCKTTMWQAPPRIPIPTNFSVSPYHRTKKVLLFLVIPAYPAEVLGQVSLNPVVGSLYMPVQVCRQP